MAKRILQTLMILSGIYLVGGCGDDSSQFDKGFSNLNGFSVVAFDPDFGATFVPLDSSIRVKFNEPVDPDSITGNFKLTETIGSQLRDVTKEVSFNLTDSNSVIVFTLARALLINANYKLTLFDIKSASQKSLNRNTENFFSTSDKNSGTGANTKPGPPQIASVIQDIFVDSQSQEPCLGYTVRFNEDLRSLPLIQVVREVFRGGGLLSGQTITGPVLKTYTNRLDTYSIPIGCGCAAFGVIPGTVPIGTYLDRFKVSSAIDAEGNDIEKEYSKTMPNASPPIGTCLGSGS